MSDSTKSVEDLEREADRSRAEVSGTLQELRTRLSPDVLKSEMKEYAEEIKTEVKDYVTRTQEGVKDYARHTGEQWVHTVRETAIEHPLAATMIGAGLAWKALGVLRAMGVPGLLLGAGIAQIALAEKRSGEGPSEPAERRRSPAYRAYAARGADASHSDWFEAFKAELDGRVRQVLQLGAGRMSQITDEARGTVTAALGETGSRVGEVLGRAQDETLRRTEAGWSAASEAASSTSRRVSETMSETWDELRGLPKAHPALVIGAGIAAGAAAAAAFASARSSDAETLSDMSGRSGWQVGDSAGDWEGSGDPGFREDDPFGAGGLRAPDLPGSFRHGTDGGAVHPWVEYSKRSPVAFIALAVAAAGAVAAAVSHGTGSEPVVRGGAD